MAGTVDNGAGASGGVPGAWPMGTVALSVCMFARTVSPLVECTRGSAVLFYSWRSQIRIRRCPNIHQRSPTTIVRRPINTPFGARLRALAIARPHPLFTLLTSPPAIPSQLCCGSSAADLVDEPKTTRTASEM